MLPDFDVSRETLEKLEIYQALLLKWQKTINLIAPSTLKDVQNRHFMDSMQIAGFLQKVGTAIDIGSGAGFPGLVLAATSPNIKFNLVESDQRKCQFLRTVSREAIIPVSIHNTRVEAVDIPSPDIITARALASLDKLLDLTEKWWTQNKDIKLVFLKGIKAEDEIRIAQRTYNFDSEIYQSKTDLDGRILLLTSISRIP